MNRSNSLSLAACIVAVFLSALPVTSANAQRSGEMHRMPEYRPPISDRGLIERNAPTINEAVGGQGRGPGLDALSGRGALFTTPARSTGGPNNLDDSEDQALRFIQDGALADPTGDFVIGMAASLLHGDNQKGRDLLAGMLEALSKHEGTMKEKIAQKRPRLQDACKRPGNAERCAQLARDMDSLRKGYGDGLLAIQRRVAQDTTITPEELADLIEAMTAGGQAAMDLAIMLAMQIAELSADNEISGQGSRGKDPNVRP